MTLKKVKGTYHVQIPAKGRNKFITTGATTKVEAEKIVADSGVDRLSAAAKTGRLTQKSIGQILTGKNLTCLKALEEYHAMKLLNRAPKTVSNHVLVITNWMKDAKVETVPPSAVTTEHIAKWINNPESTWKRSMRQIALSSIRNFFDFMFDKGYIVSNPSKFVELDYSVMSHEQKEQVAKQPFTDEEVSAINKHLQSELYEIEMEKSRVEKSVDYSPKVKESKLADLTAKHSKTFFWYVAMRIGLETGLRLCDIASLEWRSFSEPGKLIVWTEKTNRRVEHEISEDVQIMISKIPVEDTKYIFPEQRAVIHDIAKRALLSVQFSRLCDRLEINGKSFHSLRHMKATKEFAKFDKEDLAKKLAESLSLDQIASLLGHSNTKTTKGYVH